MSEREFCHLNCTADCQLSLHRTAKLCWSQFVCSFKSLSDSTLKCNFSRFMSILSSWLIMRLGITWEGVTRELIMSVHVWSYWAKVTHQHESAVMWLVMICIVCVFNWYIYIPSYFCVWIYCVGDVFPKLGDWMSSKSRFEGKASGRPADDVTVVARGGCWFPWFFCVVVAWSGFAWARVTAQWRIGDLYAWVGDCPAV